ncbi:hypothetical protein D3C83_115630 [compost metagenome]
MNCARSNPKNGPRNRRSSERSTESSLATKSVRLPSGLTHHHRFRRMLVKMFFRMRASTFPCASRTVKVIVIGWNFASCRISMSRSFFDASR